VTDAQATELASMVSVLVPMDGEEIIVTNHALVLEVVVMEMESVSMECATATLAGPATLVNHTHACMTALSMVSVIMVLACVKTDIVVAIVPFRLSLSLANAPFTVCVAVCNSVPRSMNQKVLDRLMSATKPVLKSVFPNALRAKCKRALEKLWKRH